MQGDSELQDLYRDVLLDYFRSGTHKGKLDPADIVGEGVNPLCGDSLLFTATLKEGRLDGVKYQGHGCVISQSSAAMMAETLVGKTPAEAEKLTTVFKAAMTGKGSFADFPEDLEELKALEGVAKYPVRIKCALLSWNTLLEGLKSLALGRKESAQYQETE